LLYKNIASMDEMDIHLRTEGMNILIIQSGNNTIKVLVE